MNTGWRRKKGGGIGSLHKKDALPTKKGKKEIALKEILPSRDCEGVLKKERGKRTGQE